MRFTRRLSAAEKADMQEWMEQRVNYRMRVIAALELPLSDRRDDALIALMRENPVWYARDIRRSR